MLVFFGGQTLINILGRGCHGRMAYLKLENGIAFLAFRGVLLSYPCKIMCTVFHERSLLCISAWEMWMNLCKRTSIVVQRGDCSFLEDN